jgi:hypothetical protein
VYQTVGGLYHILYKKQKGLVQILKDVFGAAKSKRHGEGRKYVFDLKKLERLGKIYDLSIDIQVVNEPGNGTHRTHGTLIGLDRHIAEEVVDVSREENVNNFDNNKGNNKEIILQEQQGEGEGPCANAKNVSQASQTLVESGDAFGAVITMCPKRPNLNPAVQFTGSVVLIFLLVIVVD